MNDVNIVVAHKLVRRLHADSALILKILMWVTFSCTQNSNMYNIVRVIITLADNKLIEGLS